MSRRVFCLSRAARVSCAAVFFAGMDQWTKAWAVRILSEGRSLDWIPGIIRFTYVENTGMAFGFLQGRQTFLFVVSVLVIAGIAAGCGFYVPRYPFLFEAGAALTIGGGLGNAVDRLFRHYVVDFICFLPIDFPVFNAADSFLTIGIGLLAIELLANSKSETGYEEGSKWKNGSGRR